MQLGSLITCDPLSLFERPKRGLRPGSGPRKKGCGHPFCGAAIGVALGVEDNPTTSISSGFHQARGRAHSLDCESLCYWHHLLELDPYLCGCIPQYGFVVFCNISIDFTHSCAMNLPILRDALHTMRLCIIHCIHWLTLQLNPSSQGLKDF